jgi:hypothetical protein
LLCWKKEYIIFILESKVFGVIDFSISIFYDYFVLRRIALGVFEGKNFSCEMLPPEQFFLKEEV